MSNQVLILSAGKWGNALGLKVRRADRDNLFKREWDSVELIIDGQSISIYLSDSFWNQCHEFRDARIDAWLRNKNLHQWDKGFPHRFKVKHLGRNQFEMIGRASPRQLL